MKTRVDIQGKMIELEMARRRVRNAIVDRDSIAFDAAVIRMECPEWSERHCMMLAKKRMEVYLDQLNAQIEILDWTLHNGN